MVHGHAVLEHIIENNGKQSLSELKADIHATHGEDVLFEACSADGMNFEQLITFLLEREKIEIRDDKVYMVGVMCDH